MEEKIDLLLLFRVHADQLWGDEFLNLSDRLTHPALRIGHHLGFSSAGAGWGRGSSKPRCGCYVNLQCFLSATVENFSGGDVFNNGGQRLTIPHSSGLSSFLFSAAS